MRCRLNIRWLLPLAAAFALSGCQSYDIMQTNVFADDDGRVVSVDYGRSKRDHVNTFVSPMTGKEMEFKSKLVIRVTLPDGDRETAWQCMNLKSRGTTYKTDNEKWMFLVNGFTFFAYVQTPDDKTLYREVFRGVLCDTPEREVDKSSRNDSRWYEILPEGPNRKDKKVFKRETSK